MIALNFLPYPTKVLDGEIVALRQLNPQDPEELKRLFEIEKHETTQKFMVGQMKEKDLLNWFSKGDKYHVTYAVIGKSGYVDESEVSKIQGWVHVLRSIGRHEGRVKEQVFINEADKKKSLLEISFAKYPGAKSGQISSAVRQAVYFLGEELGRENIVITAYTSKENIGSRHVLTAAGFIKVGVFKYLPEDKDDDLVFILDWNKLCDRMNKAPR